MTALPYVSQFVEHCSLIKHHGRYILHSQAFPGHNWSGAYTEGGAAGGRSGVAHATYDFDDWPDLWQWAFALPEPEAPADRGAENPYDQVHLGVGAASLGNACVGVYGVWHGHPDFGRITGDLGLVVSNDGIRFREPAPTPGHAYIDHDDSPATPVPGHPSNTILCQGNGILNVGDQTRIYHGRWRNVGQGAEEVASYSGGEVALATLRRDRWGAIELNPGAESGAIVSAPVTLGRKDCEIRVNADGVAALTIDLLDERLRPIADYSGARVAGPDGVDCRVRWEGRSLCRLGGRQVRVRVGLRRMEGQLPRVYALYAG